MAFKFPFTNYHELNLTWVLEQLKKLFEESEENVETIETYDNRLSAVESEVSTLETTTSQAINTANAAATNAATALSRANTANQNALTASSQAGAAVTAAQESQQEAQAATQAAQQAQATVMTFDGRITQAQNDASAAVQEAQSFENRVNAAINTANNAANTATIAQGIAVNANQTAAQALDELNAQRDELVTISEEQQEAIEDTAERVIASIPSDYTQLSEDVKNKAPLIVANASGEVVFIKDGADDMEIRQLLATINPIQAGTGTPSPSNVRPISGRTSLSGMFDSKNLLSANAVDKTVGGLTFTANADGSFVVNGTATVNAGFTRDTGAKAPPKLKAGVPYTLSGGHWSNTGVAYIQLVYVGDATGNTISIVSTSGPVTVTPTEDASLSGIYFNFVNGNTFTNDVVKAQLEVGNAVTPYEKYQHYEISIDWQSEAGTIYKGYIDIITGELTVTYKILRNISVLQKSELFSTSEKSVFSVNGTRIADGVSEICSDVDITSYICNRFASSSIAASVTGSLKNTGISASRTSGICYITVPVEYGSTLEDFNTWLSNNPTDIMVKLITPLVYQLDPETVKTLLGYNTIYTDCGPVSVDYPADTKLYIDGKFTELQALILEN